MLTLSTPAVYPDDMPPTRRPAPPRKKGAYHHGDLEQALVDTALQTIREDGVQALVARLGLQAVALDPLRHQVEHLRLEMHRSPLCVPPPGHEPGPLEHLQVLRDGLQAHVVRRRQLADGRVARLHATQVDTSTPIEFDADLVLLAMGFVGPERNGLVDGLGIALTERGTVARDRNWMTSVPGVFAAGDMQRGQSLIVWAIADGRSCARGVDAFLMGSSSLPAPVA